MELTRPLWRALHREPEDIKFAIQFRIEDRLGLPSLGMFSIRGDYRVGRMVKQALTLPEDEQQEFCTREMNRISAKHGEVFDTDVRESIQQQVPGYSAYEFDW